MNKTLIALLISSIVLAGCGKSDEEIRQEQAAQAAQLELIAAQNAKAQQEADDIELAGIITELKKGDPLIKDAYYGYNEKGDRVLHVVRDTPPEQQQQQYQGANGQPVVINNQQPQQASSGVSETVWPLLAGAGAGMLLAQAMNSSGGFGRYQQYHQPYSNNYYSDNDYRRTRTKVINNYHTVVINKTRETVRTSPAYQSQYKTSSVQAQPVKKNTAVNINQTQYKSQSSWGSSSASKPAVKSNTGWGGSTIKSSSSSSRSSFSRSSSSRSRR